MADDESAKKRGELRKLFAELKFLPANTPAANKARRGQQFENLIGDLLHLEGMKPLIRLRPSGEEVDGSFKFDGRIFLLEAKWQSEPQPASAMYEFRGKVEGKLQGTLGVFISMSGFADKAADALTRGKVINMVLFDGEDFEECLAADSSFAEALDLKLRAAAEKGIVHHPYRTTIVRMRAGGAVWRDDIMDSRVVPGIGLSHALTFITQQDQLRRNPAIFDAAMKVQGGIKVIKTHGIINAARIAGARSVDLKGRGNVVITVDSDQNAKQVQAVLRKEMAVKKSDILIVDANFKERKAGQTHGGAGGLLNLLKDRGTRPETMIVVSNFPHKQMSVKQHAVARKGRKNRSIEIRPIS